jgi:hypothetical protein
VVAAAAFFQSSQVVGGLLYPALVSACLLVNNRNWG